MAGPKPYTEVKIGDKFGCFEVIDLEFKPTSHTKRRSTSRSLKAWWCTVRCLCGQEYERHVRSIKDYPQPALCKCSNITENGKIFKLVTRKRKRTHREYLVTNKRQSSKSRATKKGLEFDLSLEEVERLLFSPCAYCGHKGRNIFKYLDYPALPHNGIDRVNNDIGYILGNVVPCCAICNFAKSANSPEEFKEWVQRISEFTSYLTKIERVFPLNAAHTGIWTMNKTSAKSRNLPHTLTKEEYLQLALSDCYYCGIMPCNSYGIRTHHTFYNGLDRKNNLLGYTLENCVPCCLTCNSAKLDRTYTQFLAYIAELRAFAYFKNKSV